MNFGQAIKDVGIAMSPLLGGIIVVGILANVLQVGLVFNPARLAPNLAALNPVRGAGKIFGGGFKPMPMLLNITKLTVLSLVAYSGLHNKIGDIVRTQAVRVSSKIFSLGSIDDFFHRDPAGDRTLHHRPHRIHLPPVEDGAGLEDEQAGGQGRNAADGRRPEDQESPPATRYVYASLQQKLKQDAQGGCRRDQSDSTMRSRCNMTRRTMHAPKVSGAGQGTGFSWRASGKSPSRTRRADPRA